MLIGPLSTVLLYTVRYGSMWSSYFLFLDWGLIALLRQRTTRLASDTALARRRKAHPLARKLLKSANRLLSEGDPSRFYADLEGAVLGFLGNRLNIHEKGMTRPQLTHHLTQAGIRSELCEALIKFLNTCDAARFAPIPPEKSHMEEHLMVASDLLSSIAEEITCVTA